MTLGLVHVMIGAFAFMWHWISDGSMLPRRTPPDQASLHRVRADQTSQAWAALTGPKPFSTGLLFDSQIMQRKLVRT